MTHKLTFATRPSALARWQTDHVRDRLQTCRPDVQFATEVITTRGDRVLDKPLPEIGGKGLFTFELEEALRSGRVDAAVHSLKDLPIVDSPGLTVGLIPQREDPHDVWICPAGHTFENIPQGAVVGTSSNRRRAQLLARRPDLDVRPIRGNVDTRLRKVQAGEYMAIVLAAAGVRRLGLVDHVTAYFSSDHMLPAPGQGALGVQCRADDDRTLAILQAIEDADTRTAVTAERAFLAGLGGGCSLPVGAYATVMDGSILLRGVVAPPHGGRPIWLDAEGDDPITLGTALAQRALARGAAALLEGIA